MPSDFVVKVQFWSQGFFSYSWVHRKGISRHLLKELSVSEIMEVPGNFTIRIAILKGQKFLFTSKSRWPIGMKFHTVLIFMPFKFSLYFCLVFLHKLLMPSLILGSVWNLSILILLFIDSPFFKKISILSKSVTTNYSFIFVLIFGFRVIF